MSIINSKNYSRSSLERKFEMYWERYCSEIELQVEARLIPGRQFRCDYYHPSTKIVIELHGGEYMDRGGHSTAAGKVRDATKQNALVSLGYRPFVLHTSMVTIANIKMLKEVILNGFG